MSLLSKTAQVDDTTVTSLRPGNLFVGPYKGVYNDNFIEAFNVHQKKQKSKEWLFESGDKDIWKQVINNYDAFCDRMKADVENNITPEYQIPKKYTLIWLGNKDDTEAKKALASWKEHHPDWDVQICRDAQGEALIKEARKDFPNVGKAWDRAIKFAEKADILRLYLIYINGGGYADSDLPCFGKVDELHCYSDFYVGMEVKVNDCVYDIFWVSNALIAAKPKHPIIKKCLEEIKPRPDNEESQAILERTGPCLIRRVVIDYLKRKEGGKALVLPPSYFFPLHWDVKNTLAEKDPKAVTNASNELVLPWTKGLHYQNQTWF